MVGDTFSSLSGIESVWTSPRPPIKRYACGGWIPRGTTPTTIPRHRGPSKSSTSVAWMPQGEILALASLCGWGRGPSVSFTCVFVTSYSVMHSLGSVPCLVLSLANGGEGPGISIVQVSRGPI